MAIDEEKLVEFLRASPKRPSFVTLRKIASTIIDKSD